MSSQTAPSIAGVEFRGEMPQRAAEILTLDAVAFVAELARRFGATRQELLARRQRRQQEIVDGRMPDFLPETASVRSGDWRVAPIPRDLLDRRVEITGPVDRKMIINALNSGANVFMADFEDSNSPTWRNNIEGQINLRDAVRREIAFTSPEGKQYGLNQTVSTLIVRPRGWHLPEKHMLVVGQQVPASLFDFGLFFFHNAAAQIERGTGPYFYLPKMESHLEARLWNEVFTFSERKLGIPDGTIRATVLIETILAAFEMDEILFELRDHSAGLNCGRWDYIFSFIKKFRHRPDFVLPDRAQVTMERHFLKSYVDLLIQTCHKRGIHAMGGMAAQIPIKNDPEANNRAIEKVRSDKLREVRAGHDGTWVAHPGLVPVAREVFDAHMKTPNQIETSRDPVTVGARDLLAVPEGEITQSGLELNVDVGIQYLEAWLGGNGCVPIYNLMEDAATAEISRTQVWQWVRHGARLSGGKVIDGALVGQTISQQLDKLRNMAGAVRFQSGNFEQAARLFQEMSLSETFPDFLTLPAYEHLD
ncbi:MAG TPA: malate synthase A [Candidatus Solibacter sp.]|nr:malate synthase A [Candidatus Solibacter sp.]